MTKPNKAKRTARYVQDSTEPLHVDADGIYKPGKPMRASQPWNWSKTNLRDGTIVVGLTPPRSTDTATTVRYEAALIEPALCRALSTVRVKPDISLAELRRAFPELDKRCSDPHLKQLKESAGRIRSLRKFEARILADAAGYLDEDTVYRYLKFKHSRQVKKAKKGRPRSKNN